MRILPLPHEPVRRVVWKESVEFRLQAPHPTKNWSIYERGATADEAFWNAARKNAAPNAFIIIRAYKIYNIWETAHGWGGLAGSEMVLRTIVYNRNVPRSLTEGVEYVYCWYDGLYAGLPIPVILRRS